MEKLVIINGSPRPDEISNTYKALQAEKEYFIKKYGDIETVYIKLPSNMQGCLACDTCVKMCNTKDELQYILSELTDATDVLLGSPVYLDMPTPQVVSFLTRLNCMAESTGRNFFRDKNMYLLATGFCSGTKSCIHVMMSACEMLGFTIPGRSTREYIVKWSDNKLRGGMNAEDFIYLD